MIALIAAFSLNHVIGRNGTLPWDLPEDLRRFRELTTGHTVIMGRKTYESIGRPLPNRVNIVVNTTQDFAGCLSARSLLDALEMARGDAFVIGGSSLFNEALPLADRLYLTLIDRTIEGDTYFPPLDWRDWRIERETPHDGFRFVDCARR